jgi:hypothetical protein
MHEISTVMLVPPLDEDECARVCTLAFLARTAAETQNTPTTISDFDPSTRQHHDRHDAEGSQAKVWPHRRPQRRPQYVSLHAAVDSHRSLQYRENMDWRLTR